jgi:mannose/fructose/N-acetylgalactosamine-specific phosphotransferase system component IIC
MFIIGSILTGMVTGGTLAEVVATLLGYTEATVYDTLTGGVVGGVVAIAEEVEAAHA